ncbi:MAG: DUF3631 domain-containing protein, partial [Thiobacillaceae bacterium]
MSNPLCHNEIKNSMKTQTVLFDTITPHPSPVHVAGLLTHIEAVIKKHVILSDPAAAALAVWVLHTWTFELRDIVAYVAIESPEKRCGKTTLLSVLAAMARKPLIASNVTLGALFRAIDTCRPTLFIDEADTFLAGNGTMRGIINSGNTWRTAYVLRLSASRRIRRTATQPPFPDRPLTPSLSPDGGEGGVSPGEGESVHSQSTPESRETGLKKYSCWCPKVIAMIGQVPDTIADRSIVVPMSRKLVTETCAPLAELNTAEIKAKCARFALDARDAVAQSPKIRGEGLNDRAADTFDPLYVIARLAGDGWEHKLHAAALALNAAAQSNNSGAELLLDILCIFIQSGREKILIRDLAVTLREGGHGMKSFALKYSDINEHRISQILRSYGVKTTTVRDGKQVGRGYGLTQFQHTISRYVPVDDFRALAEELSSRQQLQAEARAEAEKEEALMEQALAAMPKDRVIKPSEARTLITRLRQNNSESVNANVTNVTARNTPC